MVDRSSFIAWSAGILLSRDAKGRCIVGDSVQNEEAGEALQRGETVGLLVNGRMVSTIRSETVEGVPTFVERKV